MVRNYLKVKQVAFVLARVNFASCANVVRNELLQELNVTVKAWRNGIAMANVYNNITG